MAHSYQASLDYLYSLQLFGIKLGLDKVRQLLQRLDNPQHKLRIVHIAGTNGKGSTAATLANIFHAAGIRAGLYTSPHLHSFTERIRVDLQQIPEAEVVRLIDELRPHAEELRTTFFEFTTAMALLYFARSGCEWAVLEVGMGGRLDATNAVEPRLCLVTPVGLDHTEHLGSDIAAVAKEKAGIFKAGVPVISGPQDPAALKVLRRQAEIMAAPFGVAGEDFRWRADDKGFSYQGRELQLTQLTPGLEGEHQQQNLALALAAAEQLREQGVRLSAAVLRRAVAAVRWPGRLEWLPEQVLLDGAHNPAGAATLAAYLQSRPKKKIHLLIGLKANKDAHQVLEALLPLVARLYACPPPVDSAVAPELLAQQAAEIGIPAVAYPDPELALQAALKTRLPGELLVVAGSLFLVAAVREMLLPETVLLSIGV